MKELTIEQKAQRYDEAIKKANELLYVSDKESLQYKTIKHILPELEESEDEKIRNFISNELACLRATDEKGSDRYEELTNAIAWLEKKGEHAKFRDSIQVGDKVTRNQDGVLVNLSQLKRVAKKDEKQGDKDIGISEATKQELEDNLNKALEKETPESWNEFLDEGEQNPAWSEEDEKMYTATIFALAGFMGNEDKLDWLKSFKYRYTYKPSDEQMQALSIAMQGVNDPLFSLYQDLKKLREE